MIFADWLGIFSLPREASSSRVRLGHSRMVKNINSNSFFLPIFPDLIGKCHEANERLQETFVRSYEQAAMMEQNYN